MITLYHQDSCPQCKMVTMLLNKNNIEFEANADIEEMKTKGITHTPALEVNGEILQGKSLIDWINKNKK